MARAIDKWALTTGSLLLLCALSACKKRDEPAPLASVSPGAAQAASAAVAEAAAAASAAQAAAVAAAAAASASGTAPVASATAAPALGEVKRFTDKEKSASGTTKVLLDASKVYDEPDATKPSVASLPKDLVVTRLAALGNDWVLIQFPSGVGKVAPGWIEAKALVAPTGTASGKPATSASAAASAKPAASAVASAVPAPSASAPKVRVKPGVLRAPGR
jgi:hypothetical protein